MFRASAEFYKMKHRLKTYNATFLHRLSYLGLSQSRVRNCTPPPQVREHWPNSLHEPQFPSCFMMSGVNQIQWPLKQCWNRPRTKDSHGFMRLSNDPSQTWCMLKCSSVQIPSHSHTWCHQWAVLSWSCRRRDYLGGYTTAAYMGQMCDTAGHKERLLTIKSPDIQHTHWVTDWPSVIQINHHDSWNETKHWK